MSPAKVPPGRRDAILAAARRIARDEGWTAVTTRRLSREIGFTQPVLYSHFSSMGEVAAAVAEESMTEVAELLDDAAPSVRAVAEAYLDYARSHPAEYEALASRGEGMGFATEDASDAMKRAFAVIERCVGGPAEAEILWAGLHGLAELERHGRIRPDARASRLVALENLFGARS